MLKIIYWSKFELTGEERPFRVELTRDAAHGPDVDGGVVAGRAEEDFGSAVPERKSKKKEENAARN